MMQRITLLASLLGLLCFLMLPAMAQQPPPYVNVVDYGATPDANGNDDSTGIEAAIGAACSGTNPCRAVYFPKGEYVITNPIDLNYNNYSVKLFGTGIRRAGYHVVKPTQISWNGSAGGTMMNVVGVSGLKIEDLAFNGDYQYNGNKAGIGIDVQYTAGSPSAEFTLSRMLIEMCTAGFKCEGGGCNSDMTFLDCCFSECNTGFYATDGQNVDFAFIRCEAGFDTTTANTLGFWFAHGSSVIFHELCTGAIAKVIKMDDGAINGGCLSVYGWKPETYLVAGNRPTLLDVGGNAATVHINSLCTQDTYETATSNPKMFILRGKSVVNIVASQLYAYQLASVGDGNGACQLTFDTCQFGDNCDPRSPDVITYDSLSAGVVRDSTMFGAIFNYRHDPTTNTVVPGTPSGLTAVAGSTTGSINLSWTDNSNNEVYFGIGRSTNPDGPFGEVGTVNPNVTSWIDTGRTVGTRYYYKVYVITTSPTTVRWMKSLRADSLPKP